MFTDNVDHRSGLYDVWVYFPRTLISAAAYLAGRNQRDLGEKREGGFAFRTYPQQRKQEPQRNQQFLLGCLSRPSESMYT